MRPGLRTVLGFDYGKARIGVAIAQELTADARPLALLTARRGTPPWPEILRLVDEWRAQLLVVGVPYHADGSASKVTTAALAFAEQLQTRTRLPVAMVDERLSSYAAADLLAERGQRRRNGAIDSVAAAVILNTWLHHGET